MRGVNAGLDPPLCCWPLLPPLCCLHPASQPAVKPPAPAAPSLCIRTSRPAWTPTLWIGTSKFTSSPSSRSRARRRRQLLRRRRSGAAAAVAVGGGRGGAADGLPAAATAPAARQGFSPVHMSQHRRQQQQPSLGSGLTRSIHPAASTCPVLHAAPRLLLRPNPPLPRSPSPLCCFSYCAAHNFIAGSLQFYTQ